MHPFTIKAFFILDRFSTRRIQAFLKASVVSSLLILSVAQPASAMTISFGTGDLSTSTTTTSGGFPVITGLDANPANWPSLPPDSTFSNPFNGQLLSLQGKFWRYNFTLPSGYTDLTFFLELRVNDEMAVYVNDTIVLIQSDTALFPNGVLTYRYQLNQDGSTSESSTGGAWDADLWNYEALAQSAFQAGANEITIYGIDTCCGNPGVVSGGLTASDRIGEITFSEPSRVPEPITLALFGVGLAGMGLSIRRKV